MDGAPSPLAEAIDQLIALGYKEPQAIEEQIVKRHGESWLAERATELAHDILLDVARQRIRAASRSLELRLSPGDPRIQADIKIAVLWVPDEHGGLYLRYADLTPDDLRRRAAWDRKLAGHILVHAVWCEDVADAIEAEGKQTLGELERALPALPELEAVAA